MNIFTSIFYQPLWNGLVWFYNVLPGNDIGLAIIALTIAIKLVLFPASASAIRSQRSMQALQPKIKALQEQFKDNKEQLAKEMMELYKKEKVSPFSSCLPLILQLFVLFALYRVLIEGLGDGTPELLYSFVKNPGKLDPHFIGLNLAKPNIVLAVLAGLAQFWQTKLMQVPAPPKEVAREPGAKDESVMAMVNKQMLYVMPVMTVVIGAGLPGGLALYWFVMSALSAVQQWWVMKKVKLSPP